MAALELIVGPPNSGRAGEVEERLRAALPRDPVLVVPTSDDVASFEERLCEGGGGIIGLSIRTFRWLVEDVADATGAPSPPPLSEAQRQWLCAAAAHRAELRLLARSARRRGFAPALLRLVDELQAALVEPNALLDAAAATGDDAYETELARAYALYLELRDESRRGDPHSLASAATTALRANPDAWGGRPVFLYGFDDLTEEQLELVLVLRDAAPVTVAVNWDDREALAARAELFERLRDLGGTVVAELPFDGAYTESAVLRHLDRHLFEPGAPAVEPDEGIGLLESAGERAEAEAIGGRIARLLADGVPADEILVVLRSPERHGSLYDRVLGALGIPVAVEASVPLPHTSVGRAMIALARATSPAGSADDLLRFMRASPGLPAAMADSVEGRIRRSGAATPDQATEGWKTPPRALERLRSAKPGGPWLQTLAALARETAEEPHRREEPTAADSGGKPFDPLELRAAAAVADVLEDIATLDAALGSERETADAAIEALEEATVPLWRGPPAGRVRVLSPYRARAARARHLFCASLQDGEFPAAAPGDPLLGDQRRAALPLAALKRRDPAQEERYLFHACVSRPVERLWLSWRSSDEDGRPSARSAFVEDVLDLLAPDPEAAEQALVHRRSLEEVVFALDEAPTQRELKRSIAALSPPRDEELPGPLTNPAVLSVLAQRNPVGSGTLEKWIECPYRWFVDHELVPQRLEPAPEPLTAGSIVHEVLERLYREAPGKDKIPREGDLSAWRKRAGELLEEVAAEHGLATGRPLALVTFARMRAQIERFLEAESKSETTLRPLLIEARFGEDEAADRPPLELGETRIHGMIDRVDVSPEGGFGVVRDYKTSASVSPARRFEEDAKLQVQLYAVAAGQLWDIEPVGALYHALAKRGDTRPRGALLRDSDADGIDAVRSDRLDEDEFAGVLDRAVERAQEAGAAMRGGKIDRDPNNGRCPKWCRYQPICRLERAIHADSETSAEGAGSE
jgi:ATP-dependent helicase/DNAse subunit B